MSQKGVIPLEIAGDKSGRRCKRCRQPVPILRGAGTNRPTRYCSRRCMKYAAKERWRGGLGFKKGHEWDALMPEQVGASSGREPGEYALLIALLERSVMDLSADGRGKKSRERGGEDYEDARAWFDSDSEEPWSFRWVALHLGFSAEWFRAQLSRTRVTAHLRRRHSRSTEITRRRTPRYSVRLEATPQDIAVSACNG